MPRPEAAARALNVVLVDTGAFEYGLVVEELHDTVEIVVKPLGRHLKGLHDYAGATILGDGRVAVILDVAGLAARGEPVGRRGGDRIPARRARHRPPAGELHALLLFHNAPGENCAVPIEQVSRIERVRPAQIEYLGGRRTMQYCGASLPLVSLHDTAAVGELTEEQQWVVIVFERLGRPLGLLAAEPLDMVEAALNIDTVTLRQRGIAGSAVLKDRTILLLDIFELADAVRPEGAQPEAPLADVAGPTDDAPTVLVADDSDFFRGQIQRLVEAVGCRVLAAEDGQAAWETARPARRRGRSGGHRHRDAAAGRAGSDAADSRRRALCRAAGHRAVLAGRRRRNRPRHGGRRRRVSDQAQQGRVNG